MDSEQETDTYGARLYQPWRVTACGRAWESPRTHREPCRVERLDLNLS